MLTLYELKNVEAFDLETISLLVPFIYISEIIVDKRPITVKNLLKRGSNNLQIRYDRCFQQKKGYCSYPDSVLQQYPKRMRVCPLSVMPLPRYVRPLICLRYVQWVIRSFAALPDVLSGFLSS